VSFNGKVLCGFHSHDFRPLTPKICTIIRERGQNSRPREQKREPGQLSLYSDGLWAEWMGFNSRQGQVNFLICAASRTALGPTQPPI
jgi:hypothetical protein